MNTETPVNIGVFQIRHQCGVEDFSEMEKSRKLAEAERDSIVEHVFFCVLLLAAIFAYAAFGAGWVAR
jgi:hypothetical protein